MTDTTKREPIISADLIARTKDAAREVFKGSCSTADDVIEYMGGVFQVALDRNAANAAPDLWQPIATAPRDGSNILIKFGSDGVSQAKYTPGWAWPWIFIDTNDGITWMINRAVDGPGGPSHWMPMPDSKPCRCRRLGDWNGLHHPLCSEAPAYASAGPRAVSDTDIRMLHSLAGYMANRDDSPMAASDLANLAERLRAFLPKGALLTPMTAAQESRNV
ncbi:hypothetical protein [Paraburkholderia sp. C35]|uniref:hypothetical protein n=1 Tax=Paraburkholderia sp. C35 TaxID=2126993 RepID=UPI000D68FB84|nr:hypothetical protein [Paraburkholderia sp. C35]